MSHKLLMSLTIAGLFFTISACAPSMTTPVEIAPNLEVVAKQDAVPTNDNLNSTLWVQTAVEYRGIARQSYMLAKLQLLKGLKDTNWTASPEQTEGYGSLPPAVILDVDETVLDNSPYQARMVKTNTQFHPDSWGAWVEERKAFAIPGALEFCKFAKANGVKVFYVTNRDKSLEAATRANLEALGFPFEADEDTLFMKKERDGWGSAKGTRRIVVGSKYRILLLIGDNLGDFVDGYKTTVEARKTIENEHMEKWGSHWIVLPNPTYGSWMSAIFKGMKKPSDLERAERKYDSLTD